MTISLRAGVEPRPCNRPVKGRPSAVARMLYGVGLGVLVAHCHAHAQEPALRRLDLPSVEQLPLPRRVWWPWTEPTQLLQARKSFKLAAAAPHGTLYLASTAHVVGFLDGRPIQIPHSGTPSWTDLKRS